MNPTLMLALLVDDTLQHKYTVTIQQVVGLYKRRNKL